MRVISQAGLGMDYDIPYEEAVLKRYEEVILCVSKHLDREVTIAQYSTEAKAIKAMEMLREAYTGKLICQNIDMTKDVEELLKSWNTQAIITGIAHSEPKIDYINSTIFQFPKDEDLEVDDENML